MLVEPESKEFRLVAAAAATLQRAGYRTMLVGGSVRDLLIGKDPKDFDLVTVATPDELAAVFPGRTQLVGASFGVSLLKLENCAFEVATAREERNYLDGRHPESVRYSTDLKTDVVRRDPTNIMDVIRARAARVNIFFIILSFLIGLGILDRYGLLSDISLTSTIALG